MRWFYGSFMAYPPRGMSPLTESVDATVALLSRPRTEVWVRNTQGYREGSIILQRGEQPPNEGTMSSIASAPTGERWSMTSQAVCPRQPATSAI